MGKIILHKTKFLIFFGFLFFNCNDDKENKSFESPQIREKSNLNKAISITSPQKICENNICKNLQASEDFVKFSFSLGSIMPKESEHWDIAFLETTIALNGGVYPINSKNPNKAKEEKHPIKRTKNAKLALLNEAFEKVLEVPPSESFLQDSIANYALVPESEHKRGWYKYNWKTHIINPIENRTIVIKTHDNKYIKMKIRSYYEDETPNNSNSWFAFVNPPTNSRYYTFEFEFANATNEFKGH